MKKTILIAAMLSAGQAHADPALCKAVHTLSGTIMSGRQRGVDIIDMVDIADGDTVVLRLIRSAYEVPRYSSQDYIDKAVGEFKAKAYISCLEAVE